MAYLDFLSGNTAQWKAHQKALLRFFLIYFFVQAVPLDWKYYAQLFSIQWGNLHYGDLFHLSRYYPRFFPGGDTYANWLVAAGLALVGALIWGKVEQNRQSPDYDRLYYVQRVILRYRLALGILTYGFLKIFLLQAPFPSLSHLNTAYGDFTAWKIFTLSLGVAPVYEIFLGVVEVLAGLLLLYRKTASIGAFVILCFTGNVFLSNLAYEGGESIYSLYLVVMALFLFAFDAPRLIRLLSLEKPTAPNTFQPVFATHWQKSTRLLAKSAFVLLFVFIYAARAYSDDPYKVPQAPGLSGAAGIYNVKTFVINRDTLPYSASDPLRWKDVVFEKWATLSVRSLRPVQLAPSQGEGVPRNDREKTYELEGSAGRHYYHYGIDSLKQVLVLHNKNPRTPEQLILHYERPDTNTIRLRGLNENRDSIWVTLEKIPRKYLLVEGRRRSQKL